MKRGSGRKEQIILEYQRQMRLYGHANYSAITRAVGLKSNTGSYAARVVQKWREAQDVKGQLRECLCCPDTFLSTGKHHRLCDKCRTQGEYYDPFPVSPSLHFATSGRA